MNTLAMITIVAFILVAAIAFAFYHYIKPKTSMEKIKEVEKKFKKNQEAFDKSIQKIDSFKNNLLKKNDELLKEMRKYQG